MFIFVEYGPSIVAVIASLPIAKEVGQSKEFWMDFIGVRNLDLEHSPVELVVSRLEIHELGDQLKLPPPVLNPDSCW